MIKRVKNKKIPKEKSLYFKNIQGCQEHHFILSLAAHASLKVLGIVSYHNFTATAVFTAIMSQFGLNGVRYTGRCNNFVCLKS